MQIPLAGRMEAEQDKRIAEALEQEQRRLSNFIRKHVPDRGEAEDILQDVFYEFVLAYRLTKPIEHARAWLFRVARNRITDLFRKRQPETLRQAATEEEETLSLDQLLPSAEAGPEAAFARSILIAELEDALEELPKEQRDAFIAHEIEGRSFKELSAEMGVTVNTLLSRKHYAVLRLRERLQSIYDDFKEGWS
jgi:RNA polymerase sigma factor (sigma-70 family)